MYAPISYSFTPGEILAPGTTLKLQAHLAVNPATAKSAVRLLKAGKPLTIDIKTRGNVIEVSTDKLAAGHYQLAIGKPLTEPTTVPVIIGALIGKIPDNLRVEHAVHMAVGDTSVTRLRSGNTDVEGTATYLELVKAVDRKTGALVNLAFDAQGNRVDSGAVLAQVERNRNDKFGRVHEGLWNRIKDTADDDNINVIVWPKFECNLADYRKASDCCLLEPPKEERKLLERIVAPRNEVTLALRKLNAVVQQSQGHLPPVFASLPASKVRELAKSDSVGLVCFNSGKGILDLKDSIAISRSNLAQDLGFTGEGVNVAVFEEGPDNFTNLEYAARYIDKPPASTHARLTSAIIKNTQPDGPHGHAPKCNLYSANSFENDALLWAVNQGCTVISQSFHRDEEETLNTLSSDDLLKDWLALQFPYPTILQAAGNGDTSEFVNHKGYNTLSVGSCNDTATELAGTSVLLNPESEHGDRELPELVANGTQVSAVGITLSGTSFSAPAAAGVVALLQHASSALKSWPEGCRAILLASAGRNVTGSTWWDDVVTKNDGSDGSGALDAEAGVRIAQNRKGRNAPASQDGWDVGTLTSEDIGENGMTKYRYSVRAPSNPGSVLKVALTWQSIVIKSGPGDTISSTLTVDLDLVVKDDQEIVSWSSSYDNSYEVVEFAAHPGKVYDIVIRRSSGTDNVRYGVAWTVFDNGRSIPLREALRVQ